MLLCFTICIIGIVIILDFHIKANIDFNNHLFRTKILSLQKINKELITSLLETKRQLNEVQNE